MVDEEEITFPPTYRFERDTREKYVYTKAKATGVSLWLLSSTAQFLSSQQCKCTRFLMLKRVKRFLLDKQSTRL